MTVDLNSRTTSLKRSKNILIRFFICILMTALILTEAAPSFADEETKTVPSAETGWSDAPEISAEAAILIDSGSGEILYEKNAYDRREPASITKMLTALIAIETLDPDMRITTPDIEIDQLGTNINMKEGEVFTVEQLLYAILLESANEAADTMAIIISGSTDQFADLMNERAAECGAKDTEFSSASGLVTSGNREHFTTAYDLAMIAKEAMKNPTFREIVGTVEYTIPATNLSGARELKNSDVCLYETKKTVDVNGEERPFKYDGANGIKTGFTDAAGYCFCGSAERDGTELIGVVLGAETGSDRFADIISLWDYGFSKYYTYTAAEANRPLDKFRVWQGEKGKVQVSISEDMDITLNNGYDSGNIKVKAVKNDGMVKAPVEKGQVLGRLEAYNEDGELIAVSDLKAMSNVEKGGPLSYIGIADENRLIFFMGLIFILITLIMIRLVTVRMRRKRKKRRQARRNRNVRRREWEKEKNPFDR